jgi:hypothetical protein
MNTTSTTISTGQIIWDTILALRENGQAISRQRIMELTGLAYTKVDDHVSRWVDDGRMRRVIDGVYELVEAMPDPRPVQVTDLHNGQTLIECGDQEMLLWGAEVRALARQLGGYALQYAQLQTQHDVNAIATELLVRNRALADRISDLEREHRAMLELPGVREWRAAAERQRKALAAGQMELTVG